MGKTELKHEIDEAKFSRFVAEAERLGGLASEYQQSAGGYTKSQLESLGIDTAAWGRVRSLRKKPADRQVSIIAQELKMLMMTGSFDQIDAFSPLVPVLEAVLEHVRTNDNRPKSDPLISELVGA